MGFFITEEKDVAQQKTNPSGRRILAVGWRRGGKFAACATDPVRGFSVHCKTMAQFRGAALRHHMLVRSQRQ